MVKPASKVTPPIPVSGSMTPGGGKTSGELVRQSNRWRDNYNPLRGLVIAKAIAIIEAAERGAYAELQLTMRKVERRYPVLKGLKARRLAALEKLDWDIKVIDQLPDGISQAQAEAQQKFLRSRYELVGNLTEAFGFLVSPEFRGYAVLQKHKIADGGKNDGAIGELHWLPQDVFCRNGQFGDFYYNQNSNLGIGLDSCQTMLGEANRIGSEQLPREDFIIREAEDPIYEIALIAFVNWCMGRKDWAAFTEIFGLPNGVAIMPPNIPAGLEDDYRIAAEKVADGVSGALPNGSDIKFPSASVRGEAPFKSFCDAQDADVVLAGTGGRLAMLTAEKGGLGDGPAQEHAEAFDEIAQSDARKINAVLQRDFDIPELAAEFPGQPIAVYFELGVQDKEDVSALADTVVKFEGVNLQTDVEEISERAGLKLTRVMPAPTAGGGSLAAKADLGIDKKEITGAVRNRAVPGAPSPQLTPQTSQLAEATAEDLQATLKAIDEGLQKVFSITDPATRLHRFRELWASTKQIRDDAARYPAAALALQKINAEALARGLEPEHTTK